MISTNDKLLNKYVPPNITWNDYMKDCEKAINTSNLHSDEWSTDDEALADGERAEDKRPERIKQTNSVIKIHEKKWRSTRVCEVVIFLLFLLKYNIVNNISYFLLDSKIIIPRGQNRRNHREGIESCTPPFE